MYLYKIKFSELSLDMFRMLQSCEREPSSKNDKNNNQRLQNISIQPLIHRIFIQIKHLIHYQWVN
jgi:hypothetical protein